MRLKNTIIALSLAACSCMFAPSAWSETENPVALWSQGNKHFTTNFYPHAKQSGHNFVFSPISIQLALGMTSELAVGTTKQQLVDIAVLPDSENMRRLGAEHLLKRLNTGVAAGVEPVALALTNGAWLSSEIVFSPNFETALIQYYQAGLNSSDFKNDPDGVREGINQWVEEQTTQQIQNLLPEGSIDTNTKLVLVNTLYMKAPWEKAFSPSMTYEAPFFGLEKSLRPIPYMHQVANLQVVEDANCTIVELPFKASLSTQDALSLFVVLPHPDVLLSEVEDRFSTRRLQHWLEDMSEQYVDLKLPKFKVSSKINAKDILNKMGLTLPFSTQEAEFDLLDAAGNVVITDIIHEAVFEVDEAGGTGSAATGVIIGVKSLPYPPKTPKEINVNRPFMVIVADKTTGVVLFAGRIMQP